ncbi:hypothetical protein [Crocosphaera subtropica]|nr:hypothetical protein [Crocosphaera subtropica]
MNSVDAIFAINDLLNTNSFDKKIQLFWAVYPEIKAIMIDEDVTIEEGDSYKLETVLDIEFTSDKAKERLKDRIGFNDILVDNPNINENELWEILLFREEGLIPETSKIFEGNLPQIERHHLGITWVRPETAAGEVDDLLEKVSQVLQKFTRQ